MRIPRSIHVSYFAEWGILPPDETRREAPRYPRFLRHLYKPQAQGRRRPVAGKINGRLRDDAKGRQVEKGDYDYIRDRLHRLGDLFYGGWMWVGAGSGDRRNVGAINRFIIYFSGPMIRVSLSKANCRISGNYAREIGYLVFLQSATQSAGLAA